MKKLFLLALLVLINNIQFANAQWQSSNDPNGVADFICLAANGSDAFSGPNEAGIYHSSNNGASWNVHNTELINTTVWALASTSSEVLPGTFEGGIFLSINNRIVWAEAC